MNPSTLQTWCSIAIFIGVVIAGLGGLGQYYFGKKVTEEKDRSVTIKEKDLNIKIESLLKGNEDLQNRLEPFMNIAQAKFPDENTQTALKRLSEEINSLGEQTKKTVFEIESSNKEIMPDGTYEINLKLNPIGKNVIPIFSITCKTENGAIINKFEVIGPTIPGMSFDRTSKDRTMIRKEYRTLYPGEIIVKIVTDKDPGRIAISIDPLKED